MRRRRAILLLSTLMAGLVPMAAAWGKEKQVVTISYVVGPPQPLPDGLKAIAVINSGVSTQGVKQDEREAKWSIMAADMIEAMLQAGSSMMNPPIAVAKRSETQAVLREHDLALAGMVAGSQAAQAGKLLAVQALITSRITISIDEQRGSKSTIDWVSIMGGAMRDVVQERNGGPPPQPAPGPVVVPRQPPPEVRRMPDGRTYVVQRRPRPGILVPAYRRAPAVAYDPRFQQGYQRERSVAGGGLTMQTKEVEEISRHLTVQCSFTMINAANGQAIVQYSPPPIQKQDRQSPDFLFGGLFGDKELDPVDHFIGELVEHSTREFVSMIVPVQVQEKYELIAKHSAAEDGLRALRGDDYATAMQHFDRELRKYSDEHETMFAMGVVSELMSKPDQALQFYRKALSAKDVDKEEAQLYGSAKDRLSAHMGRILPPMKGPQMALPPASTDQPVSPPPAGQSTPGLPEPAGPSAPNGSASPARQPIFTAPPGNEQPPAPEVEEVPK